MKIGLSLIALMLMTVPTYAQVMVPVYPLEPIMVQCPDCGPQNQQGPQDGMYPGPRFSPPPSTSPRPRTTLPPMPPPDGTPQAPSALDQKLDRIIAAIEKLAQNGQPVTPTPTQPPATPTPACPSCPCNPEQLNAKLAELAAQIALINQKLGIIQTNPTPTTPTTDISKLQEQLEALQKQLDELAKIPPVTPTTPPVDDEQMKVITDAFLAIQKGLTEISAKLDNGGSTDGRVADALLAIAEAQKGTNAKLEAAIALLKEDKGTKEITLVVKSSPNLPASYVDTSTIWAVQRKTGLSHAILVYNSADPEWARLEPEFAKAKHKFPAIQLVDVQTQTGLKLSPTPQLVLYYLDPKRNPEIVSGDRPVGAKLRELYSS